MPHGPVERALFIDESGSGEPARGKAGKTVASLWLTVGVLVDWDQLPTL